MQRSIDSPRPDAGRGVGQVDGVSDWSTFASPRSLPPGMCRGAVRMDYADLVRG